MGPTCFPLENRNTFSPIFIYVKNLHALHSISLKTDPRVPYTTAATTAYKIQSWLSSTASVPCSRCPHARIHGPKTASGAG